MCFSSIEKQSDRKLVQGRGKFNVYEEIISLQFTVHDTLHHICKQCLRKLQKRRGLCTNLRELDEEIFRSYSSKAYNAGLFVKKKAVQAHDFTAEESVSPEKRILFRGIVDNTLQETVTFTDKKKIAYNYSSRRHFGEN